MLGWDVGVDVRTGVGVLAGVKVAVGINVAVGAGEGVEVLVNPGAGVTETGVNLTAVPPTVAVKFCPLAAAVQPMLKLTSRPINRSEKYFIIT